MDHFIKEAIEKELKETPAPPLSKDETWEYIHQQINQPHNRSRSESRYKKISVAAIIALLLLLSAFTFESRHAYAWNWITKYISQIKGTVHNYF